MYKLSCEYVFSFLLLIYLGMELLHHMVSPCLTFWETIFHSGCSILHPHQLCMRVLISPNLYQHLLLSIFFCYTHLVYVKWYLAVVFICISLVTNYVEHLFICSLAICLCWKKYLFRSLVSMQAYLFSFYCLVVRVYVSWIVETYQYMIYEYFFHFVGCLFTVLVVSFDG